jgi:sulfoxide reductase heme-binding subunit YedZ
MGGAASQGQRPWLKPAVFTGALVPLGFIVGEALLGRLGANPIAEALNRLGLTALIFLVAALACTPSRWRSGDLADPFAPHARAVRLLCADAPDHVHGDRPGLRFPTIFADVTKRKFIYIGFTAFLMLDPAGRHLDRRVGAPPGLRPLEAAAPPGLSRHGAGRRHFPSAGQEGRAQPLIYGAAPAALLLSRVAVLVRRGGRSGRERLGASRCDRGSMRRAARRAATRPQGDRIDPGRAPGRQELADARRTASVA